MFLSYFTLLTALSLSVVAAWYSILGLTAIFASAVIPIIIMGSILEVAKITVTVWLHEYWHRCRLLMKMYLAPAVVMLMIITSMGIFGFLSKAHSDQSLVSGDVLSKVAIYDEKIKTQKDSARMRPSDVQILLGDNSKFRKQTGWKSTIPIEKTLEDLLNYWRERV